MVRSLLTVHTVESIREEVRQDVITEKLNRGAILDELESSIKNAQFTVKPLTIGLLEVNDFSLLSETHGKELGDACLVYVAKQLEKYLPKNSIIGRVGTNEFLVIFPDSSAAKAQALFNQVCHTMDTVKFHEHSIDLTLSVGITECHGPFESPRDMMRRADKGLKISLETEGNGINISE
jgi:diguanylate cyclase